MTYETNIVEIRKILTSHLQNVLSPLFYEGFQSMYDEAQLKEQEYIEVSKVNPAIKNPGVIVIFQECLEGIKNLNANLIEAETTRIRDNSKCADHFDNLIRATIKAHIALLSYNVSGKRCKLIDSKFHESIDIKQFIHKCYTECSTIFHSHALLFWHGFPNHELKHNQQCIFQLIKIGIKNAIMNSLPMKDILDEYLSKDYIQEHPQQAPQSPNYMNVGQMINRDMGGSAVFADDRGGSRQILADTSTNSSANVIIEDDDINENTMREIIYGRATDDTISSRPVIPAPVNPVTSVAPVSPANHLTQDQEVMVAPPASSSSSSSSPSMIQKLKGGGKKNNATKALEEMVARAKEIQNRKPNDSNSAGGGEGEERGERGEGKEGGEGREGEEDINIVRTLPKSSESQ